MVPDILGAAYMLIHLIFTTTLGYKATRYAHSVVEETATGGSKSPSLSLDTQLGLLPAPDTRWPRAYLFFLQSCEGVSAITVLQMKKKIYSCLDPGVSNSKAIFLSIVLACLLGHCLFPRAYANPPPCHTSLMNTLSQAQWLLHINISDCRELSGPFCEMEKTQALESRKSCFKSQGSESPALWSWPSHLASLSHSFLISTDNNH